MTKVFVEQPLASPGSANNDKDEDNQENDERDERESKVVCFYSCHFNPLVGRIKIVRHRL